jgi:peroxiredoxin family protein/TusA-related sulfurtransferase
MPTLGFRQPNVITKKEEGPMNEGQNIVDCRGMMCPAPILRVAEAARSGTAESLTIFATDPDFVADIEAWCRSARANLLEVQKLDDGSIRAKVALAQAVPLERNHAVPLERNHIVASLEAKAISQTDVPPVLQDGPAPEVRTNLPPRENQTTLLVLKNDYESLLSALMIANASAAQGMKVKVFFAFWAINMLRARTPRKGSQRIAGFFQSMLKMLMPRGMRDQRLGKLNMGGLGRTIFLWIMKGKNIMNLEQLVDQAVKQDIEFVVCSMSMGMMGVDEGEIVSLPNIRFAGVTSFAAEARQSCTSLVF